MNLSVVDLMCKCETQFNKYEEAFEIETEQILFSNFKRMKQKDIDHGNQRRK